MMRAPVRQHCPACHRPILLPRDTVCTSGLCTIYQCAICHAEVGRISVPWCEPCTPPALTWRQRIARQVRRVFWGQS